MRFYSMFDYLKRRSSRTAARPARRGAAQQRPATGRLQLEALEERYLLSFDPAVNYAVASSPQDVAVADFNSDAKLDFASVGSSALSVALGNGDGSFLPAQTTSIGYSLRSVAAGDLNADGKLDLAATASVWRCTEYGNIYGYYGSYWACINSVTEGFVKVLMGNGNGTFQSAQDFIIASNPNPGSVALGDFNNDGELDAATANTSGNNVSVLLGNGDGTLQTARNATVGSGPRSVAVGDLNADGKLDLVTANQWSNSVSVLDGNGDGTFQPARDTAIGQTTHAVAVGDLNADGKLDVAVTSSAMSCTYYGYYGCYGTVTNGYVNVLLGNGGGTFAPAKTTWANNSQPVDVALGDFNVDGNLDVATADQIQLAVDPTVLLGKGDGTFDIPYNFDSAAGPIAIAVADLNGDAAPDLAVANSFASNVSILLNDRNWQPLGTPIASISDVTVTEGNTGTTAAVFTVSLSAPYSQPISVQFSTADDTATAGSDYQAISGTLNFNPGGPLSQTVTVLVNGDRLAESYWGYKYFSVNLSNPSNVRIGDGQGVGTIVEDEPDVTVGSSQVTEGNTGTTAAVFTVTMTAASDGPVTVNWSTNDDTATAGSDYQAAAGTLIFNLGAPLTQTITVLVNGDRLGEYRIEHFSVTLSNGNTGYGTIVDNEPIITVSYPQVTEGNAGTTAAVFTVTMTAASDGPVTVNWSTSDGAATAGSDYQASSGTLIFNLGAPMTQTVTVPINGDRIGEYSENFFVTFGSGISGYGTILDDEPRVSISDVTVTEGNTGTTAAVFTVSLAAAYDEPVRVNFSTAEGDTEAWYYCDYYGGCSYPPPAATVGSDFQAQSGMVTFDRGETRKTISVVINGDRLAEDSEYFSVDLTADSANAAIGDGHGVGVIADDEPLVSIDYGTTVSEGNSGTTAAVFTVRLSAPYDEPVSVDFATVDGSAIAGSDYVARTGTVIFAPNETTKTFTVSVTGDVRAETNEYFSVNLTRATLGRIVSGWSYATILDDDTPPSIRISDASIVEGHSGTKLMVFTVSLSGPSGGDVWVNFATANGTARVSDNDYVATSGTLHFAPGETTATISVVIKGDQKGEKNECFYVNLSSASNAVIADSRGIGTILDDDRHR